MTRRERWRENYLYRAFDDKNRLLYVGRSVDVGQRFKAHKQSSPWWPHMTRRTVEGPMSFDEVDVAERSAIMTERPMYNADEPTRSSVNNMRRRVYEVSLSVVVRDGWLLTDAHDIADAVADRIIKEVRTGDRFEHDEWIDADWHFQAFMSDPLGHIWLGYHKLVSEGWSPEWGSKPQHRFIPEEWDSSVMGDLPGRF